MGAASYFQIHIQKFNCASRDLYPEFWIVQQSFLFSCDLLFKRALLKVFEKTLNLVESDKNLCAPPCRRGTLFRGSKAGCNAPLTELSIRRK